MQKQIKILENPFVWGIIFYIGLLCFITFAWKAIFPFLTGLLIAYILHPTLKSCEQHLHIPQSWSIAIVAFLFYVALTICVVGIVHALNRINLQTWISRLSEHLSYWHTQIDLKSTWLGTTIEVSEFANDTIRQIQKFSSDILIFLVNWLTGIINNALIFSILTPISLYYFAKDKNHFLNPLKLLVPKRNEADVQKLFSDIDKTIGKYIQGQFWICLLTFAILSIVFACFSATRAYALFFSSLGGLSVLIPYLGTFIGSLLPALYTWYVAGWLPFLQIAGILSIVHIFIGFLIAPKFISTTTNIHPLSTLFALSMGNMLFGITGMIFAVPVTIILKILIRMSINFHHTTDTQASCNL